MNILREIQQSKLSRRSFVAGMGASAGAALVAGCGGGGNDTVPPTPTPTTYTDQDILNFALNLEYLEAEFYLNAATGSGLSATDAGSGAGTVTGGGQMVQGLTGPYASIANYLYEVAQDELNHVRFIRSFMSSNGMTPVSRPAIDFNAGFGAFATASNGAIPSTYSPFANPAFFLLGSFAFEDVGVTAYTGAAPLISATTTGTAILGAAAGIQAAEGYHAAAVRGAIILADLAAGGTTYETLANVISGIRGSLGGGNETSLSQTSPIAASSSSGAAYARSFAEVLHIVYAQAGGAGVKSGGFFPNGLNGTITVTTA